jgi:hypothetical protein
LPASAFTTMVRLRKPKDLIYIVPRAEKSRIERRLGKSLSDLVTASATQLRRWLGWYDVPIETQGRWPIAWVTELSAVPPLARLVDRLGLTDWVGERVGLIFEYTRSDVRHPPRLPRAFDGMSNPQFAVEKKCDASSGATRPLTVGETSLPEAIHRGCQIPARRFTLQIIE